MRAIAFFDGQNLYHAARKAYGYEYPDFDPYLLSSAVCALKRVECVGVRVFTGVHRQAENPFWHAYWSNKIEHMRRCGVVVHTRELTYRYVRKTIGDVEHRYRETVEKGIDVMLAVDLVSLAHQRSYDTALIFSQDQDLATAVEEVYRILDSQGRRARLYTVLPIGTSLRGGNPRGIHGTDWFHIRRQLYDRCRDSRDYRPFSRRSE